MVEVDTNQSHVDVSAGDGNTGVSERLGVDLSFIRAYVRSLSSFLPMLGREFGRRKEEMAGRRRDEKGILFLLFFRKTICGTYAIFDDMPEGMLLHRCLALILLAQVPIHTGTV